jgi:hypothetical protein
MSSLVTRMKILVARAVLAWGLIAQDAPAVELRVVELSRSVGCNNWAAVVSFRT